MSKRTEKINLFDVELELVIEYDETPADNGVPKSVYINEITIKQKRADFFDLGIKLLEILEEELKEAETEKKITASDELKNMFGGMNAGITL